MGKKERNSPKPPKVVTKKEKLTKNLSNLLKVVKVNLPKSLLREVKKANLLNPRKVRKRPNFLLEQNLKVNSKKEKNLNSMVNSKVKKEKDPKVPDPKVTKKDHLNLKMMVNTSTSKISKKKSTRNLNMMVRKTVKKDLRKTVKKDLRKTVKKELRKT